MPEAVPTAIEVSHLVKTYAGVTAVADISFTVARGEIIDTQLHSGAESLIEAILEVIAALRADHPEVAAVGVGEHGAAGRPARGLAAAGLVVAGGAAVVPLQMKAAADANPFIHDITTDMADPPVFVAVLPLRASAANAAVYAGDSIAALQRAAYPEVQPLMLPVPPLAVRPTPAGIGAACCGGSSG